MPYKVVTADTGQFVFKGFGKAGLTEEQAKADAADRNQRAEQLGVRTRYKIEETTENDDE